MAGTDEDARREAAVRFCGVARYVTEAMGASERVLFDKDELLPDECRQIARWWARCVDDQVLRDTWLNRDAGWKIRERRDELFWARDFASRFIQTDLFLTGPPFPGPR
jgi:hypothetical protein